MQATNYLINGMLNIARGIDLTAPTAYYIGLFLGDPTATGTGAAEISYTGYARQVITFTSSNSTNSGYIQNSAQITFPQVPRDIDQTVTHIGIMDAETGGNMLLYAELADPVALIDVVTIFFAASSMKWTFSGIFTSDYRVKFLNYFKNGTSVTGFTPYLSMYNSSGAEKSSGNYTRMPVNMSIDTSLHKIYNTDNVDFPVVTSAWGVCAQCALVDAASGGTKFVSWTFATSFNPTIGSQVRVNAGDIIVTMQDPA